MTAQEAPRNALRFVEDDAVQQALLRVFERARDAEDPNGRRVLVMLVSRRLACLYEMLIASGQVERFGPDQFEVVTDRVLDALPKDRADEWTGRRAVLIDDVMNLGSTLVDRYDDLVERVGDKHLVTAMVAVRNSSRSSEAFAQHLGIESAADNRPLKRDDGQLRDLARQLATCLYRSLTPYFTDFPIFTPQTVRLDVLEKLISSNRWLVADVTACIADQRQRAFSFIAAEATEDRIRRKAVAEAVELAELFKVRVYTSRKPQGSTCKLRIVPICVPGEVMPTRLDRALDSLTDAIHGEGNSGLDLRDWAPCAKHRLLQMYLSACLAEEFWNDLRNSGADVDEFDAETIEEGHLRSYFGEEQFDGVRNAFGHAMRVYRSSPGVGHAAREDLPLQLDSPLWRRAEVQQHAEYMGELIAGAEGGSASSTPSRPDTGTIVRMADHRLWVQRILNIFGQIDKASERRQAKQLRKLSYPDYLRYCEDPDLFEDIGPRVLHQGIRPREITDAVVGDRIDDELWRRVVVSLALDIGNDLGVAVPTTVGTNHRDPVSRQFRSGEGAFMAEFSHARLRAVAADEAAEDLDTLTRDAFELPLSGALGDQHLRDAIKQIELEAQRLRRVVPGDRLLQKWIGVVREVRDASFVADYVTTIGGEDCERLEFTIAETLSEQDRHRLAEGAIVEWRVYGIGPDDDDDTEDGASLTARFQLKASAAAHLN